MGDIEFAFLVDQRFLRFLFGFNDFVEFFPEYLRRMS